MADENEEILFSLNADGNAPEFFGNLDELMQQADASMQQFGQSGEESLGLVGQSAEEFVASLAAMAAQIEDANSKVLELANGVGGAIPPIDNLGTALGASGGGMDDFTNGLILLASQLNKLNPDVDAFVSKQIELTDNALGTAQALLDVAESVGAEEAALAALQATVDSLTAQLTILSEAQDVLDITFNTGVTRLSDFQSALLTLADAYSKSNVAIQEQVDKQLELAQSSRDAAQALKEYAYANGASVATVDQLSMAVDGLDIKIAALKNQQAVLNDVFGSQAPVQATLYGDAIDALIGQLDSAGMSIQAVIDKQVLQAKSSLDAAQALYDAADATVIGTAAYDRLDTKLDELRLRYLSLVEAQKMAAAVPPPASPGSGGGGATEEESPGGPKTQAEANQNAFMLLMVAQAAFQVGKSFVDMGVKAESSLTTMQAMTNTTNADMGIMTTGMEALAVQTGFGLSTMADAMYKVHSAFSNANDSLLVMAAAAKLARAGNSDLTETSDALITVMSAFGDGANKAAQDANIMAVATRYGKQTMGEFTTQIGVIAAVAQAAGMSFAEAAADEAILSLHMHNGSQAARDLSAVIRAVSYDATNVGEKAIKAGLDFNAAKFQTMDWAQKLEYLNTFTNGNAKEMQMMIGGAGELKTAMGNLDISTSQLSKNAVALGLNFDGAKYNSLSLAGQLQYLLTVSGGNASRFAALVGGTKNLNDAFQGLHLSTSDVSKEAQKLGLNFDETKFKSENLVQKLQTLKDMSHGNMQTFQSLVGGVAGANAALMLLSTDGGKKAQDVLKQMQNNTSYLDSAFATAMGSIASKGAQLGAVLQNIAYQFTEAIKPQLTVFLQGLGNMLGFLASHMQITIPIVAGLAIAIGVLLVGAIVGIVASMAGFLAAAGPFILIGAAIGAVAAIVIMNWGRIAPMLTPVVAVFQHIGAVLGPIMAAAGRILVGVGQDILTVLIPAFNLIRGDVGLLAEMWGRFTTVLRPLLPILQGIGLFIIGVLVVAFGLLVGVLSAVAAGLGYFIAGLTSVITGVIGIVMGLVQVFTGVLHIIHGIFTLNGNEIRDGFSQLGKGILNIMEGMGMALVGVFVAIFGTIYGIVVGFVTGVISFFVGLARNLVGASIVPDMLNAMLHWFVNVFAMILSAVASFIATAISFFRNLYSNLVTITGTWVFNMLMWIGNLAVQAIAKIQSLIAQITGFFSNLAGMAVQWGSDLISGFISGVQNMAGNLISTISGLAGKVAAFLHFTKPDVGPLATADEWMPHFGDLLETGMLNNVSKLQAASHKMALAAGSGVAVPAGSVGSLGGGNQSQLVTVLAQILSTLQQQSTTTGRVGTPATLGGLTAVTQQFGSVNINGVNNPMQLHRQLNMLAGLAQEYADRGAISGLAV